LHADVEKGIDVAFSAEEETVTLTFPNQLQVKMLVKISIALN
jgi:hypothetical protein